MNTATATDTIQAPYFDYYENAEGWQATATVTLHDLIDGIRSDEYAAKVSKIRGLTEVGEKNAANALKKTLPAVSLSGTVTGRRKSAVADGRFVHSGLLQIDLDAKDNPDWTIEQMVEVLKADPHIIAGFRSPSGEGVKGIACIPADATTHKAAFLTAEAHFAALGLSIDKSCKDPVRLCFVSHDPQAWICDMKLQTFQPVDEPEVLELGDPAAELDDDDTDPGRPSTPTYEITDSGGIIIRGNFRRDLDAATVRDMLKTIPPRPPYADWIKIASAVWDALGEVEGTAALCAWSPEEEPGEYAAKFQHRLKDVHAATLVMLAKSNGWAPTIVSSVAKPSTRQKTTSTVDPGDDDDQPASDDKNTIPANVFPVPSGEIGHDLAARHIFSLIGPSKRLFMRGSTVHEVTREADGESAMTPVSADRFVALVETFGPRVMRREQREDGTPRWRATLFPASAGKVALVTDAARECLPTIRQLISAPVIAPDDTKGSIVLCKGYHPHAGGTFITRGSKPPEIPLAEAKSMILEMLEDFEFTSSGDASRALASFISPALKFGGWIQDDFPLDIAEADQSQSGKTYRQKLICAIYKEAPGAITQPKGGVGSLDERVSSALIAGRPFISFDNFRGRMDSQILETAIRGLGKVSARALRTSAEVDCTPFLWQLSTNGAELTRDLANRSIITRIRKRADTHVYRTYPEGDILAHVKANQPRYLGAIHAIVREWASAGRPRTDESRHDFRVWCRTLDWIVQTIFGAEPLLDGHKEEQMRTANPNLQWVRSVVHAILKNGYKGHAITASDFGEVAEEHDIEMPGRRDSTETPDMRVGKLLGRVFREMGQDTILIDGVKLTRLLESDYDPINRKHRERKSYVIEGFGSNEQCSKPEEQPVFI
jgi:hypothetical protein